MGSTRLSGSQRGRFAVLALGVVLTLAMVGCGAEEATETPAATGTRAATAEATTAGATIQVRNAWARPSRMAGAASPATHDGMAMEGTATPSMGMEGTATVAPEMQNGGTSAIFMTIENSGDPAGRLIRASADVGETVELYRSAVEDRAIPRGDPPVVTLDDLLEQVVGKFTTVPQFGVGDVYRQADGSFVVDGTANVRELNRAFHWTLPEHGPKTLNGLILEALEDIPDAGTSLRIGEYTIEVVHSSEHAVRSARVFPPHPTAPSSHAPGNDEQAAD